MFREPLQVPLLGDSKVVAAITKTAGSVEGWASHTITSASCREESPTKRPRRDEKEGTMSSKGFVQTFLATLLSSSLVGIGVTAWIERSTEQQRFTRDWRERSLVEVVGPVTMHLSRTSHIAELYREGGHREKGTSYLQAQLLRESNERVRSILISRGHLIPDSLQSHARALVRHYDAWLLRFDAELAGRAGEPLSLDAKFDIGFSRPEFPEDAPAAFEQVHRRLRAELYGL